jgi:hypothetical protein
VFDRFDFAKLWRGTAFRRRERLRQFAALIAVIGLYAQLAAAGLCTCDLPRTAGLGAFPICHTQHKNEATKQAQNDQAPPAHQQQPCPFCMAHCHAAVTAAPSVASVDGVGYLVAARAERAAFLVPPPARFSLGAPPRGPPVLI